MVGGVVRSSSHPGDPRESIFTDAVGLDFVQGVSEGLLGTHGCSFAAPDAVIFSRVKFTDRAYWSLNSHHRNLLHIVQLFSFQIDEYVLCAALGRVMPNIHHNTNGQLVQMGRRQIIEWPTGQCIPPRAFRGKRTTMTTRSTQDNNAGTASLKVEGSFHTHMIVEKGYECFKELDPTGAATAQAATISVAGGTRLASTPINGLALPPSRTKGGGLISGADTDDGAGADRLEKPSQNRARAASRSDAIKHGTSVRPKVDRIVAAENHLVRRCPAMTHSLGRCDGESNVQGVDPELRLDQRRYRIHWADSTVAKHFITQRDGKIIVLIESESWEAARCTYAGQDADGIEFCKVELGDSWKSENELETAGYAFAEFEGKTIKDSGTMAAEEVRGLIGRTTAAQVRSRCSDVRRSCDRSPRPDPVLNLQPQIPKLRSHPRVGEDYSLGVRELIERTVGIDCREFKKWPSQNDKWPLFFSDAFVAKVSLFGISRSDRRDATFAQMAGEKQ